ncbi:MAG: SpoIIE family protein phosphatase [Deltaproteobacteria bacterium]|nr:SpoIIE family protein phosphatase [Deltaproteobacteria bacterium]
MKITSAQRPFLGEKICGDVFVVLSSGPITTIAVADGLGHGPMAAEAAKAFCEFVSSCETAPLVDIIRDGHKKIRRTRGAVGALLRIDESLHQMEFAGVGNIGLHAISKALIRPVSSPGIIGKQIRNKIIEFRYPLAEDDLLVMFSDGVSARFDPKQYSRLDLEDMPYAIMKDYGKQHDDVTCVVIRY